MVLRPLPDDEARDLARQVGVLADPDCVRLLALLASTPDYELTVHRLAELLEEPVDRVDGMVERLLAVDLATVSTDAAGDFMLAPSAAAWMRFAGILGRFGTAVHRTVDLQSPGTAVGQPVPSAFIAGPGAEDAPPVVVRIAEQLSERFARTFSPETVSSYVLETYWQLRERAKVERLLPSLTSRFATDRLHALASARGIVARPVPEVLFVCVRNSGRSQMAASILRHLAGERIRVRSAGSGPSNVIDDVVIEVLDEIGCSVAGEFPKPLTDEVVQASDIVITMGCGDACPVYAGRRYLDWDVPDPQARDIETVRRVRDDVYSRVQALVHELLS